MDSQAERKAMNMVKSCSRQMIQEVDDMEQSRHKDLDDQSDELKASGCGLKPACSFQLKSHGILRQERKPCSLFFMLWRHAQQR